MDTYAALDVATAGFARVLAEVPDDAWQAPTPDPGWSVHDLVNHVVGGNRRYVLLLAGAQMEVVEALRGLDHLGADPAAAFDETAAAVIAAFREPGALRRTVHHRLGDRSGADLLVMRVTEHAVHGWDLARAIGAPDDIDPGVVDLLLTALSADPALRPGSTFPPGELPSGGDPQRRLLALTGRAG